MDRERRRRGNGDEDYDAPESPSPSDEALMPRKDDIPEPPGPSGNALKSRVEQLMDHATVGQVHGDYGLEPVTSVHDISDMAGYSGGGGFDAMDGVDKLVLGEADAMKELRPESATEGTPLELAPDESLLTDDVGHGDLTTGVPEEEDPKNIDWMAEFRVENNGANK